MNKYLKLVGCILIIIILFKCKSAYNDNNFPYKHKNVIRMKCYRCHAPTLSNDNTNSSLMEIQKKYNYNLRQFLTSEFLEKDYSINSHNEVKLTDKQVDSILIALKYAF